jgi:hypothetical protein
MNYRLFNIYKFDILSLIEYNNIFFDENKISDNKFDILLLNITKFDIDIFNEYDLINQDYIQLNNYKNYIYKFYETNTFISKDIILLNLDNIMDRIISIIEMYSFNE